MAGKIGKIDLWLEHKELFTPSAKEPVLVRVPAFPYLLADGEGDPNTTPAFREAIGALYSLAFTLKFGLKKRRGVDFRIMPLSGFYYADDPAAFLEGRKVEWKWTLGIPLPSIVTAADFKQALAGAGAKKNASPALDRVRREVVREGLCVQILHRGPYAAERQTIQALHAFMQAKGLVFAGHHHEIYVSDPNRTAPEKLKTIVRQPVKKS
jgi:hypothetical protein